VELIGYNKFMDKIVIEQIPEGLLEAKELFESYTLDEKLAISCPTWEMKDIKKLNHNSKNPGWFRYKIMINGKEKEIFIHSSFSQNFEADPKIAIRDIIAIPSSGGTVYYINKENIRKNCNRKRVSPVLDFEKFNSDFRGKQDKEYFVHVDLATTHDSTGIAMCHEEGKYLKYGKYIPKLQFDLIYEMNPKDYQGEIQLHHIRKFLINLRDEYGFNITNISYDSWQSKDSMQLLNMEGFITSNISCDLSPAPHQSLKEAINLTHPEEDLWVIDYYHHERFFQELEQLIDNEKGIPDHPKNGSKDIADAVAGCVWLAYKTLESRLNNFFAFEEVDLF
jgi:hypothetical protein